jgi:hypothetical protein
MGREIESHQGIGWQLKKSANLDCVLLNYTYVCAFFLFSGMRIQKREPQRLLRSLAQQLRSKAIKMKLLAESFGSHIKAV